MKQSKPTYTYTTLTMSLTNGKRMSICLPYPMSAMDFEIMDKFIALQKEAMEFESEEAQAVPEPNITTDSSRTS